jgi:hypothetical protein
LNPELRRNLWLQFSALRLVMAPVVIGAFLLLAWLLAAHSLAAVRLAAQWIYYLLVLLWGTRRAGDLVAEEIAGGTWDSQRMSALGAWQMSWGKLLGGTSYVWYCAGLALAVGIAARWMASMPTWEMAIQIARMLATGLFGQALAMLVSLALLRRQTRRRRLNVSLSQIAGLAASAAASGHFDLGPFFPRMALVAWYGRTWDGESFALASIVLFLCWTMFGVYRLMRSELKFRSGPWGWFAFAMFLVVYSDGFVYSAIRSAGGGLGAWLSAPFLLAIALTYVALFIEPKDVIRYRWLAAALAEGNFTRVHALLPQWAPVYAFALGCSLVLAPSPGLIDPGALGVLLAPILRLSALENAANLSLFPLAVSLYVLRDALVVLYLNFGLRRSRGDATAFVWLLLAYVAMTGILAALGLSALVPLFAPYPLANPLVDLAVPLAECAVISTLVAGRLGKAVRLMPVAG